MLETLEYSIVITGSGESKDKAFHHIFAQLQPMIAQKFSDSVIIRIEPKDVVIEAATEKRHTERFLGVLFPRQRVCFCITARVTVYIKFIKLAKVTFGEQPKEYQDTENKAYEITGR